jgi:hypothetical protein
VRRTGSVARERLVNEAASWGIREGEGSAIIDELLDGLENAVERAALETPGVPPELIQFVASQTQLLR